MRDHRYRVWDPATEMMTYNVGLDRISEYADEALIKMQMTGLKDCNGNNVYEGDILTLPIEPNRDLMQAVVEWNFDGWKFKWLKQRVINTRGKEIEPVFHNIKFFEVIGCIYMTPELLKQENGEEVKA